MHTQPYDVVIVGAGASGTALLYTLARYTNIKKIALVEKYTRPGQVNSKASNNSQTLHVGDIETNYSMEKVRQVYPAAMMVVQYARTLPLSEQKHIIFRVPKMVLGVGSRHVALLEKRYEDLLPIFPHLQKLDREAIARVEPTVVEGRSSSQPILALYAPDGYAVDFERLSQSFIDQSDQAGTRVDVRYSTAVQKIQKNADGTYTLHMSDGGSMKSRVVVFDTDSYSLLFAKQLGYGTEYSLIPIAGNFYFSKKALNGKVYTVQEPKLPFAAVHGDPDVLIPNRTRWGPTARFHPVLESRRFSTSKDYMTSSGLTKGRTWVSFAKILLDPTRLMYLLKNMLYELPWVGTRFFLHNVKKIVPTMRSRDIQRAKGYGGMRLQRVDTRTHELQLGEGKIVGEGIIFNMTPSPGASVCLYNALRDAQEISAFFGNTFSFDRKKMEEDLVISHSLRSTEEVSLPEGYAS